MGPRFFSCAGCKLRGLLWHSHAACACQPVDSRPSRPQQRTHFVELCGCLSALHRAKIRRAKRAFIFIAFSWQLSKGSGQIWMILLVLDSGQHQADQSHGTWQLHTQASAARMYCHSHPRFSGLGTFAVSPPPGLTSLLLVSPARAREFVRLPG